MPLHPKKVRWFEVRVPREQAVHALEALAAAGSVELEQRGYQSAPCVDRDRLRRSLAEFDLLAKRYAGELPTEEVTPTRVLEQPEQLAARAVTDLRAWCIGRLQLRRRIRSAEREETNLTLLAECLEAMHGTSGDIGEMRHAGRFLYKNIFACPKGQLVAPEADGVFNAVYPGDHHDFWVVAGAVDHAGVLEGAGALLGCTPVRLPGWLPADANDQLASVVSRLRGLEQQIKRDRQATAEHRADRKVREAIANARMLRWYEEVAIHPTPDRTACQLTGWTTAENPDVLRKTLADAGLTATAVFAEPRGDLRPPVDLSNARWAKPFQLFVRLLGTPGEHEIDPTPLLAFLVPLLFGFMFPDVGHGLLLALGGYLLSRRRPAAIILVPCGLAAAGFGLLFGEVFGFHNAIPSPCGCPLENPVGILIATLVLGVVLMLLGLLFSGVEAYWRGKAGQWLLEGAPMVVLYLSGALALIWPDLVVVAVAAILWYLAGIGSLCRKSGWRCFAGRLARFVESAVQLALNTLSFMRVGAFALAHAAFSVVVLELTKSVDDTVAQTLVFVAGHVAIIVLEGLIVMVQTTRLILFEFFIRFLRFEGRVYKPLTRPRRG